MTGMFKSWKFYAIVAILLCGLVSTYAVIRKPRPKSDKPEDIAKFVASDGFKKLSDDEQKAYMRQMRPPRGANREDMRKRMDSLTEAERQAMFRNMHELRERERIAELKKYFALSKAEREKYLDEKIAEEDRRFAEFEKRMAQHRAQAAQNAKNGEQPQRPPRPSEAQRAAFMKERIETTPPEVRAARQQFHKDMQARRKATGKERKRPPRPPRG